LREALPHFLTLGPYDPATKTGPAIWLRCMVARTLPEATWPEGTVPILYLPGVSRAELREVEECPKPLQPLVELQYRGAFFTQLNGKDWTILAFLVSSDGGLELDVAKDGATVEAMKRAIVQLANVPIEDLATKRLEATDFDALLHPDTLRNILTWLNDPAATRSGWDEATWDAFRSVCQGTYHFDPETDGELVCAEKLGSQVGPWADVWRRFAEGFRSYPNVPQRLRDAKPTHDMFYIRSSWPQENEALEKSLRAELKNLAGRPAQEVATRLRDLETEHGIRRSWVWGELGQAPLARAVEPLCRLGKATAKPLAGATLSDLAQAYAEQGWEADLAVIEALDCVRRAEDAETVRGALAATYLPWVEAGAERFQALVKASASGLPKQAPEPAVEAGTCILFADGLRFDVARMLTAELQSKGCETELCWGWAALPTVTPTSKPAASPVAERIEGSPSADEFRPEVAESGKSLTADRFRQLLADHSFQVLAESEVGKPEGMAWTEIGSIDRFGHEQGWKLAWRIREEVEGIVNRVAALLAAGWKAVRIVTDHGWLLVPGGLPKTELPAYLTETRWGRCAILKSGSKVPLPTVPWHWNEQVMVASAPGVSCFFAGKEFDHGGLSLQECVVPRLTVRMAESAAPQVAIAEVKWAGLRCRIRVEGEPKGLRVDLRTKINDKASSVLKEDGTQRVKPDGTAAVVVEDDSLIGTAATVVLVGDKGRVIAKQLTTIGG
jgi:hypothetical protein